MQNGEATRVDAVGACIEAFGYVEERLGELEMEGVR